MAEVSQQSGSDATAIRPFQVKVPEAELAELRRRILATRYPARETVAGDSQGVQLATIQKLAHYWATEYDWRRVEARLSSFPHWITEVDGLDIHFTCGRSMRMPCRSSLRMDGPAQSSSSSRSSSH